MTIQEFKNIIKKEDNVVVTQDDSGDVYVIDSDKMKILAWICGEESNHFTIYSGLSDRKSWNAVNDFAETLPKERGFVTVSELIEIYKKISQKKLKLGLQLHL